MGTLREITAFFGGFWHVFIVVVGLLSGSISVFREWQIMYRPPQAEHRKVFWAFVRIAFLVSVGWSWRDNFQSMKGRETDLHAIEGNFITERSKSEGLQKRLNEQSPKGKAKITIMYHNKALDRQIIKPTFDSKNPLVFSLEPVEAKNDGTDTTTRTLTFRLYFTAKLQNAISFPGSWASIVPDDDRFESEMYWGSSTQLLSVGEVWQTAAFAGTLDKLDGAKATIGGLL